MRMGMILIMADQMTHVPVKSVQINKVEVWKALKEGSDNTTCAHKHHKTMHAMLKQKESRNVVEASSSDID